MSKEPHYYILYIRILTTWVDLTDSHLPIVTTQKLEDPHDGLIVHPRIHLSAKTYLPVLLLYTRSATPTEFLHSPSSVRLHETAFVGVSAMNDEGPSDDS